MSLAKGELGGAKTEACGGAGPPTEEKSSNGTRGANGVQRSGSAGVEEFVGPVVTILEDDADLRALIEGDLSRRGYSTVAFGSGEEYFASFNPNQAGCVVLDLRLGDMDGRDLIRSLRLRGGRQPVVVVTGTRIVEEVIEIMRLGAHNILPKPVDLETLGRRRCPGRDV